MVRLKASFDRLYQRARLRKLSYRQSVWLFSYIISVAWEFFSVRIYVLVHWYKSAKMVKEG